MSQYINQAIYKNSLAHQIEDIFGKKKNLTEKTQLGMKGIQISKSVCICFLPLVLLILILSFLLSSVLNNHQKHHHNLIFSTYEFIIVAKSSRVAVFVTCNVIIITIFLGSLKSPPGGDSDQLFSLSTTSVLHETDGAIEKEYDGDFDIDDDEEEEEEEFHGYDGYDEDNDDDVNAEDVDSEEEDDEVDTSDLHMKIEEFIDKVYKKWKEETVAERPLCIAATEFN